MKGLRFSLWLAGFKKEIAIAHSPDAVAPVVIHKRFSACPTVNEQIRRKCLHMRLTSFPTETAREAVSSRQSDGQARMCGSRQTPQCFPSVCEAALTHSTFCLLHHGKAGDGLQQ